MIEGSNTIFDIPWYLARYPDVRAAGVDPIAHYLEFGAREGRDPHPLFDTNWYLSQYPDVAASGLNPLHHYLRIGARKGYDPSPLFDTGWYSAANPDARGRNPLAHFIRVGGPDGRDPHPLFRSKAYLANNPPGAGSRIAAIEFVKRAAEAGWRIKQVDRRFAPCLALLARHRKGSEEAWIFDDEMRRLPDAVASLPAESLVALRGRYGPAARSIWQGVVCAVKPKLDPRLNDFWESSLLFRSESQLLFGCLAQWRDTIGLATRTVEISVASAPQFFDGSLTLQTDLLRELLTLGEDPSPLIAAAVERGVLTCRSPVDGRELRSDTALVLKSNLVAYRVIDEAYDLVFYVISPVLGWTQVRAIFFPQQHVQFVCSGWGDKTFEELIGASLDLLFAVHAVLYAPEIVGYLQRAVSEPPRPALIFTQSNIAHHLWNELGELDRLTDQNVRVAEIILIDGGRCEYFGPIEVLFPQYCGQINRSLTADRLARDVYNRGLCLFGPSSKYVSARLRARVLENSLMSAATDEAQELFKLVKDDLIVVLGLRAHNRTVSNFAELAAGIAKLLWQEVGRVTIVFDGWSAKGIPEFICAEQEIVARFRELVRHPEVTVIDMVGRPMEESLFWIAHSDFFVSVYGAGLAKYRWLCNKPGLLLAGRWNLRHRSDMRIYDRDEFMEEPSLMIYSADKDVEDEPHATRLRHDALHPDESQMNFRVNIQAVFENIRQLLAQRDLQRKEDLQAKERDRHLRL